MIEKYKTELKSLLMDAKETIICEAVGLIMFRT